MVLSKALIGLEVLQVVAPFSAAAAALFIALRTESRERRRQPRLQLLFDPESDDFEVAVGPEGSRSHWVRLRVANQRGRRTAEDVEIIVVDVRPRRHGSLNGFTLLWSNLPESLPSTPLPLASRQTIPPGVARHVDLLRAPPPRLGFVTGEPDLLWLQAQPVREDDRHAVLGGTTHVRLAVAARDADASYYDVTIEFDGKWVSDNEMKHRLKVSVEPVSPAFG